MAEEAAGEKTEEPTGKRVEQFREQGQIAQSKDIGGVAVLAACLIVMSLQGSEGYAAIKTFVEHSIGEIGAVGEQTPERLYPRILKDAAGTFFTAFWVVGTTAVCVGTLAGVAQTGGNFTLQPLEPKWEKFDVISGLKRAVISVEALQRVGLSLAKALVIGIALVSVLDGSLDELAGLVNLPLLSALGWLGGFFVKIVIAALIGSALLAAADYWMNHYRLQEQMKMTKQEVKDETKQSEGDPQVKARMRQRMREIGRNKMLADTRKADVIVVNPTHYAVALGYRGGADRAPRLLAKGKDNMAMKIRAVARQHQIPVVANPPVARAVYRLGHVGKEIPAELYEMVARVLAYLYRMTGRSAAA